VPGSERPVRIGAGAVLLRAFKRPAVETGPSLKGEFSAVGAADDGGV
jgi:hypothetical protein